MHGKQTQLTMSKQVTVTIWAAKGTEIDDRPGRWCQLGSATWYNFALTGLVGPKVFASDQFPYFKIVASDACFYNSKTFSVNVDRLKRPSGFGPNGWTKCLFRQRIIKE